jgi:hypothetical protein
MKFDAKYTRPKMEFYPPQLEVEFAEVDWTGRFFGCDACKMPTGWATKYDHFIHACSEECLEKINTDTIACRLFPFVGQEVQIVAEQAKEAIVEVITPEAQVIVEEPVKVEQAGSEILLRYILNREEVKTQNGS